METGVLDWLERAARKWGGRTAFASPARTLTFAETEEAVRRIGSGILAQAVSPAPVAVMMDREVTVIPAFLGAAAAGRAYAPVDAGLPEARIQRILELLRPSLLITDERNGEKALRCRPADQIFPVVTAETLAACEPDDPALRRVRRQATESDPLYIIFTSGSTGLPKGVTTSHRALMSYIQAYADVMDIGEEDRLASQSPLDYIAAIRDIYLPLCRGAFTFLLPHGLFMQAAPLADLLRAQRITALGWSASALTVLTSLGFLACEMPSSLRKICFSGSVLPAAVLRKWQDRLPGVRFVNQYGPTEATASCTWYAVDHPVSPGEEIPIGVPYANYRIWLLREDGTEAPPGEQGEICVGGPCLALGYYGDPERTRRDFIQNPLHSLYDERIYRTGDLGSLRPDGNLMFHGRKDRQIKHMGHRIELDEVESAVMALPGIRECAALYHAEKETLCLFYAGEATPRELASSLRQTLPGFMIPRRIRTLDVLPRLPNGKTDMRRLKDMI